MRNVISRDGNKILVLVRDTDTYVTPDYYWLDANAPAVGWDGKPTGRTWGEEFDAGNLVVGQHQDGDQSAQVWAKS